MKKIIAAVLLSSSFFTAPAFAATAATGDSFYAGVQLGSGFGVLGGFMLDKNIAVELDYTNYGGNAHNNCGGGNNCRGFYDTYSYSSLGGYLLGSVTLPQTPALSLFGKIGLVRTTISARSGNSYYYVNDTNPAFGLGAQYDFTKKVSGRLGLDLNTYFSSNLYIGAYYKF